MKNYSILQTAVIAAFSLTVIQSASAQTPEIAYATTSTNVNVATSALRANNPIYGDDVFLTRGGTISSLGFALFNSTSSGNTGSIIKGTMLFNFYDGEAYAGSGPLPSPLGTFSVNLDFSSFGGLLPGFYTTESVANIETVTSINVPAHLLITQQLTITEGDSIRYGVVSSSSVVVGTGTPTHFFQTSAITAPGYYTFGAATVSDIFYEVGLAPIPEPSTAGLFGLGVAALACFRRRK